MVNRPPCPFHEDIAVISAHQVCGIVWSCTDCTCTTRLSRECESGFTAGNEPDMIFPVVIGKLVAGITALILANLLAPKLLSKIEQASK